MSRPMMFYRPFDQAHSRLVAPSWELLAKWTTTVSAPSTEPPLINLIRGPSASSPRTRAPLHRMEQSRFGKNGWASRCNRLPQSLSARTNAFRDFTNQTCSATCSNAASSKRCLAKQNAGLSSGCISAISTSWYLSSTKSRSWSSSTTLLRLRHTRAVDYGPASTLLLPSLRVLQPILPADHRTAKRGATSRTLLL
jgi:hypothetical protein